ncbi:MAG: glycoside hydrolase family 13 protein [Dysgonamonadaceae bacterium]|jgi:glycosidase|nr:glycoside hydrolase family 13 protein [Dysgonamonadaceae bacterium]
MSMEKINARKRTKGVFVLSFLMCFSSLYAIDIEPAFWWTGMKNPELQLLVHGKNIGNATVTFNYPGVVLDRTVKVENPNYLFIYLQIGKEAQPGQMRFTFTEGKKQSAKTVELKARSQSKGAQGFDSSDVLYLIMPDRFANGDAANDLWDGVAIDRNDPFARHGGDLAGIDQHLDYLRDLGVTTVWLNPVLENKMPEGSYHGYAITDFYKVDQRLGSNGDYCRLIENIHNKGMKVVMDMIYNHCGSRHPWMEDLPASGWLNHPEGFVPSSHNLYAMMDVHAPQSEVAETVDGWFVPGMPDLNQRNPLLATYLIQNCIWWIEYARIDGIRHDTHPYADFNFLSQWCKAVKDEYPGFNIVGESWYLNSAPLAWWQQNSRLNDRQSNLQTVMDFNLMNTCAQAFDLHSAGSNPLKRVYETIAQDFLFPDWSRLLVFLDNHDTGRFFQKEETDLKRFKQALALILTTRGIPQIYYGTEILMSGEKQEGDGNLRKDFPGGWAEDPVSAFTKEGRTDLQNEAWNFLQTLLQWRKNSRAVTEGSLIHYAPAYDSECYVYARMDGGERVLVILNGSENVQSLDLQRYREVTGSFTSGKDILSGKIISLEDNIPIEGKGVYVLELK